MTADSEIIIPGLDHSLYKADGLLFWCKTPGAQPTQERKHVKRRTTAADVRRQLRKDEGQTELWENLA